MVYGNKCVTYFKNKAKINKKGFTLVELIVALALLLIVLDLGYMFFDYGTKTFTRGEDQYSVQQEIRLASGYVTRELRNTTDSSFTSSAPTNDGYNYIVFDSANKAIKIYDKSDTSHPKYVTNNCITSFTYTVNTVEGKYVMEFTISGTEGDRVFTTSSKVLLVNMKILPGSANTSATKTNVVTIKYKKPV